MPSMHPLTDETILAVARKHCEFIPEGTYHLRKYPSAWAIVAVVRECMQLEAPALGNRTPARQEERPDGGSHGNS